MSALGFNDLQHEVLIELLNISAGAAADVLSQMANSEIRLTIPKLFQIPRREAYTLVQEGGEEGIVSINMEIGGFFSGEGILLFSQQSSLSLVKVILSEQVPLEMLHELEEEALTEVGNVVLGACLATFADLLGEKMVCSVPFCLQGTPNELLTSEQADVEVLFICVDFAHEQGQARGFVSLMFDVASVRNISMAIDNYLKKNGLL